MESKDLEGLRTEEFISFDLEVLKSKDKWSKYGRLIANAMSAIPWVGTVFSTGAVIHGEKQQGIINELHEEWLRVHKEKVEHLMRAFDFVAGRLESAHEDVEARIQSEEYLGLARRAFRSWDEAETKEKRSYIINLITNAAATHLCPDDQVRLFNDWLDSYHEAHFKVIRAIYQHPGATRMVIWRTVSNEVPREDSAEADLFRLLIRDLSTGGVIRQDRPTTYDGKFMKKKASPSHANSSSTMESAFESSKPYTLTGLGSQFVHYTMNEVVGRIS